MFRLIVTVILTGIIISVTGVMYFLLSSEVESQYEPQIRTSLETAATSLERSERLDDFAVVEKAENIAEFPALSEALLGEYEGNYEYQRHLEVHGKGLLRWKFHFENLAAKDKVRNIELPLAERRPFVPELVFVTDEKGISVAALGTNKYDWYNNKVGEWHPSIMKVIETGEPAKDIWLWKWGEGQSEDMYHVGIAPVKQGSEKVIGVVVVGTQVGDGVATLAGKSVGGHDIAYFAGNRVFGSTLDPDTDEVLASQLLSGELDPSTQPEPVEVDVDGKRYLALTRFYAGNATSEPTSGFIVLSSLDASAAVANKVRAYTVVGGIITLVLVLVFVFIFLYVLIKPFEQIDQGIQEVIAGNKDYVFEARGTFQSEMAHSLNLMSAYLQGKRMPDEDEEGEEGQWSEFMVSEVTQSGIMRAAHAADMSDGAESSASGGVAGIPMSMFGGEEETESPAEQQEDRDTYLRRIHEEYVTAKKNIGADASDVDFDGFVKRLDKNAERLKEKHNAKDIRFSVVVRDGKVVLKPQPIF